MSAESKIAYLMHVDWDWIKQRPHFLYEELTTFYSVDLFYVNKLYGNKTTNLNSRNVYSKSTVHTLKKLPMSGRLNVLRAMERLMNRSVNQSLKQYDYIWITSPLLLDFIPLDQLKGQVVIYDCMDDFLGFYLENRNLSRLRNLEIRLVKRANQVITSSEYLKKRMISSYHDYMDNEPVVVNNGISRSLLNGQISDIQYIQTTSPPELLNLMYIGTIGGWVDFDMMLRVLEKIPDCMFTLVGPVETRVPSHARIQCAGTVRHDQLSSYAQTADALVMPFMLNELVRAVDPVKMYEYIYFNKPILAIDYEEMQKFKPFVHLYSEESEFINFIKKVRSDKIKWHSNKEARHFLESNTWKERCKQIIGILEGVQR
ncbi:hypothetical protein [Paenibacillus illinoisensis]|uniref:hypothetical protein n=1 Tax=Paenibacillus illinoisensis TaxID=59845 RepID=UPI00301A9EBD